jgi:hypothetical protein
VIRAHVNAYLARLRQDPLLASRVGDAKAPPNVAAGDWYVVVYPDQGARDVERLSALQTRLDMEFIVHSIGPTREQAQYGAERVYAQTLGFKAVVAGRSCWPMTAAVSKPIALDKDVTPPLFYAVDVFRLSSTPART